MRTKKLMINLIAGFGGHLTGGVLSFIARIVFTKFLSAAYLGVNGLFVNILTVLSLSELGLGTTMVYFLYKPVAEKDKNTIGKLMNLYRRAYRSIALVVLILGTLLCPFLDIFIKGDPGIEYLQLIYMLYLLEVVFSYLLAYKNSIFQAEQKIYIRLLIEQIVNIIRTVIQITVLIYTRNFILYLLMQIVGSLLINIWVAYEVDKTHPYLKYIKDLPDKKDMKLIVKNIKAMTMHKTGSVIVQGTDDLLMSTFVGLKSVGIYSNYNMIISNINTMFFKIYNALIGGVGNLGATEDREKIYNVYYKVDYVMYLFFSFLSSGLICFFNPVIECFFGKDYLFSMPIVLCIVGNFYITGMRQTNLMFREALGLFWYDRYKPLAEAAVNIIASIPLACRFGVIGIFVGTIISSLTVDIWVEPYILMRYGIIRNWQERLAGYYVTYGIRIITMLVSGGASWLVCSGIPTGNFGWILVKTVVFSLIYFLCTLSLFYRKKEFQDIIKRIKSIVYNYRLKRRD